MPTNTTITVAIRGTIKFRSNHSGIHAGRRIRVCKLPEPRPSSSGATVPFDVIDNAFFSNTNQIFAGWWVRVVDAENCVFCYFVFFFLTYTCIWWLKLMFENYVRIFVKFEIFSKIRNTFWFKRKSFRNSSKLFKIIKNHFRLIENYVRIFEIHDRIFAIHYYVHTKAI